MALLAPTEGMRICDPTCGSGGMLIECAHAIARQGGDPRNLTLHGQLGVVMHHGVLFRGASEGQIRRRLLQEDLFEAVISLPPNLFYGTGIPTAIVIMSRAKSVERQGKVLFVDASHEYEEGSNQNALRAQDVQKIAATFHVYQDSATLAW